MQFFKIIPLLGLLLTLSAFAQTGGKSPTTGRVKIDSDEFNQQTEKCKVGAAVAPVETSAQKPAKAQSTKAKAQ